MNSSISPWSWLISLLLLLAFFGGGYWAGDYNRNNAWLAKQALVEQQAHAAYVAEVTRGQTAASQSFTEQQKLLSDYSQLEGKFNELSHRGPLVVFRNAVAPGTGVGGSARDGADVETAVVATSPASGASADAAVGLSLGSIWLWNSALTGINTPAGACGATDTASEACATDSGIGLEAAWANHAANAKSCAQDRLRHQRLIDFLRPSP